MYAAAFGHREIVLLILAAFKKLHHVAVQGQRNSQGLTAHQLAQKNGHEDIAALLQVESQVFGKPSGPSCFVPTNPLDLDRPPTPTETPSVRSSSKRLRNTKRNSTVLLDPSNPTAPLQPPVSVESFISGRNLSTGHRRRRERTDLASKDPASGAPKLQRKDHFASLERAGTPEGPSAGLVQFQREVSPNSGEIISPAGDTDVRDISNRSAGKEGKGGNTPAINSSEFSRCWTKSRLAEEATGIVQAEEESPEKESAGQQGKDIWDVESLNSVGKDAPEEGTAETQPKNHQIHPIAAPDAAEKQVLEELMRDLTLYGSPGSGNEADTESLMECDRSPRKSVVVVSKMSGPNNRKMTVSNVPLTVAALTSPNESMPKIELSSSSRSLNRSIQHLVQEDAENKPSHRPPTPARPSLPTLLPGRVVEMSLNASMASSKSDGRHNAAPSRRLTFSSFPRSSSEPRSLTSSPRPHQTSSNEYDEDDSDENASDMLESSTRSEGWDHLRGSRGRGPAFPSVSDGHVVSLPPINQSQYSESGWRGHNGMHGRGGMNPNGENVLSVAKKTLEQLESVLAPTEAHSLSRSIPRTRGPQQIHMET
ncbi:uncharacterized protein [Palaemon carinicauda]